MPQSNPAKAPAVPADTAAVDRPCLPASMPPAFGSDVVAETLRALDIPYIALNPGASYRGLHDSLVNYLGNEQPQMLLCLHEESAVAIAHGYAKVTGKAMAAAVHSNVGLMHATMAIFNAWCDRMPMLVLGATGPVDADQAPARGSTGSTPRATRARWSATTPSGTTSRPRRPPRAKSCCAPTGSPNTAPCGPAYVNLDAELQEGKLPTPLPPIDASALHAAGRAARPIAELVKEAADAAARRQEAA